MTEKKFRRFKTEIDPTPEQKDKINKTIGTCRYVYNFYIAYNKDLYNHGEKFLSGKDFSLWLNNEFLPNNPDYLWIKDVSSKSVKQSIENANNAFLRFFKHQNGYPKFKKKNRSNVKMYFIKNNPRDCECERHRIKIPTLGWVKLKEKGYLPITQSGILIKSGTISIKAGRYYVSVLVEIPDNHMVKECINEGIGIDLGIKNFAVLSNGTIYKNINKSNEIIKLEKRLKIEQRRLSNKYKNLKKGEAAKGSNIQKQLIKVQKIHQRIYNIRTDYMNKTIAEIVKTKPSYITIEDLDVSAMMKNKYLSKAVASQKFYEFKIKLEAKCNELGIELRIVDRWYPSSKLCHECGCIKKDLKLSDRKYICECGYSADRDYNASLNLRDAKIYKIA